MFESLLIVMFAVLFTLALVFGAMALLVWIIDPWGEERGQPPAFGCTGQHGCDRCPRLDDRACE